MKESNKINVLTLTTSSFSEYEVDGIDHGDYPDYCDAFISTAVLSDGTSLTDDECEELNELNYYLVQEMVQNFLN